MHHVHPNKNLKECKAIETFTYQFRVLKRTIRIQEPRAPFPVYCTSKTVMHKRLRHYKTSRTVSRAVNTLHCQIFTNSRSESKDFLIFGRVFNVWKVISLIFEKKKGKNFLRIQCIEWLIFQLNLYFLKKIFTVVICKRSVVHINFYACFLSKYRFVI